MSAKLKRRDILLVLGILAAAAVFFLFYQMGFTKKQDAFLRITVAGEVYGEYALNVPQEIPINGTNTCKIDCGEVQMIQSNCPDHLCEKQKKIDARGGNIICLPNRVVLEIVAEEQMEIDGITS